MSATPSNPKVTVLMPVYNGERYLGDAMESILDQTFDDFEFLIVDDGSSDGSADIVKSYTDRRIRFLENEDNRGLVATLNRGIANAKGEYIARMDCDDISLPNRLKRQVAFMDSHPDIGACGTWVKTFGGPDSKVLPMLTEPEQIRCGTFFNSRIVHPTAVMRRSALEKHGLCFDQLYRHAEDYAFWVEALKHFDLANLGEVNLLYRLHPEQVSSRHLASQRETVDRIRRNLLADLGIDASEDEFELHSFLAAPALERAKTMRTDVCRSLIRISGDWFGKLKRANEERRIYPEPAFSEMLFGQWFIFCMQLVIAKGPVVCCGLGILTHRNMLGLKRSVILKHLMGMFSFKAREMTYRYLFL